MSTKQDNITRRFDINDDYDYVDTEEKEPEPEYYYYYYYDYLDSGIDISHELTTHEPLPSPLPLISNSTKSEKSETEETSDSEKKEIDEN